MVDLEVLVAVSSDGRSPVEPAIADIVRQRSPTGIRFRPDDHIAWCTGSFQTVVGAWSAPADRCRRDPPPWRCSAAAVDVLAGWGHLPGRPLLEGRPLLDAIGCGGDRAAPPGHAARRRALDELSGQWASFRADATGAGSISADPFGSRNLYLGRSATCTVVSTSPELVARCVSRPGGSVRKDPMVAAWLAWCSYLVGDRTGFDGVRVLEPGATIRLRPGAGAEVLRGGAPWEQAEARRGAPTAELIEEVRCEAADAVLAAAHDPDSVVDLTGGRDSRAVLAVALDCGAVGELRFRTVGDPTLGDVQVACELASAFGLRHEVTVPGSTPRDDPPPPWSERARRFVEATAGMVNVWNLRTRQVEGRRVRVRGFFGEALRTYFAPAPPFETPDELARVLPHLVGGGGQLVRDHVRAELLDRCVAEALSHPDVDDDPYGRLDRFAAANTLRRFGPLLDLEGDLLLDPLGTNGALRAGYAVAGPARRAELVHYSLIASADPALAAHRFAGRGWDVERLAPLAAGLALPPPGRPTPRAPTGHHVGADPEPLVARLNRGAVDDRFETMAELFSDPANPVWDVADRGAALAALARAGDLPRREQRALYGVATGALWLGA